jgi:hypothetical protein
MDGCIVKMLKLLIWSEYTCKQKKKLEWEGEGRNEEKKGKGRGGGSRSLPPPIKSVFYEFLLVQNLSYTGHQWH